ncbi:MAG: PEGA domain-containing protein, partial [Burkholderiales bacterium]|nr:PEGA domain-containing protein [Burkholderiales bacterium]
ATPPPAAKAARPLRHVKRPVTAASHPAPPAPAPGSVQLAISPWGQIEVDGAPAGTTPPLARLTLAPGAHRITVRNADFAPYTVTVQVGADKPVTVRHQFGS